MTRVIVDRGTLRRRRRRMASWLAKNQRLIWKATRHSLPHWDGRDQDALVVGNGVTAGDFFSELCLRVLRRAGSYVPERGAVSTWVWWQARGLYAELQRGLTRQKRRREQQLPVVYNERTSPYQDDADVAFDPPDEAARESATLLGDLEHLRSLYATIPERVRGWFLAHWRDGRPFHEIARTAGVSQSAVTSPCRTVLARLKERWYDE